MRVPRLLGIWICHAVLLVYGGGHQCKKNFLRKRNPCMKKEADSNSCLNMALSSYMYEEVYMVVSE